MDIYEKLLKCASVLVMLCSIFSAAARNFIHPGLLHSQDDLKRITRLVKENSYPAMGSYDLLRKVPGASFEEVSYYGEPINALSEKVQMNDFVKHVQFVGKHIE